MVVLWRGCMGGEGESPWKLTPGRVQWPLVGPSSSRRLGTRPEPSHPQAMPRTAEPWFSPAQNHKVLGHGPHPRRPSSKVLTMYPHPPTGKQGTKDPSGKRDRKRHRHRNGSHEHNKARTTRLRQGLVRPPCHPSREALINVSN